MLNSLNYKFYTAIAYLLFAIMLLPTLILYIAIRIFIPYNRQIHYAYKVNRTVMRLWAPLVGLNLKNHNICATSADENYIVVMNHVNIIDMFLAAKCLKIDGKPLIKQQILKIPILGWMFSMTAIPVDRSNKESRANAYSKLLEEIDKNISLLVFPEGSRNKGENMLNPFKTGAFKLAIETNTKILPVAIIDSRRIAIGQSYIIKPGKAQLHYLDPIDPSDFGGSVNDLKEYCFQEMKKSLLLFDHNLKEEPQNQPSILA